MDELTLDAENRDEVLVTRVRGRIFLPDVPAVMAHLAHLLTEDPRHAVVCDVSELEVPLSEWVLTLFPATLRRVGGWPLCSLRLAAPGAPLARELSALRMDRYLPVHATVDDAVRRARGDGDLDPHELLLEPDPGELQVLRAIIHDLWPYPGPHGRNETILVADELASNAIRHVGEPFTVTLAFESAQALVAVTDPSRLEPVTRHARRTATTGRGLQVVRGFSRDWGVRLVHGQGKTVWATLPAATASTRVPRSRSAGT